MKAKGEERYKKGRQSGEKKGRMSAEKTVTAQIRGGKQKQKERVGKEERIEGERGGCPW